MKRMSLSRQTQPGSARLKSSPFQAFVFLASVSIKLLCISDLYPVPFLVWTLLSKRVSKIPGEAHSWELHLRRGSSDPIPREDHPPTSSSCSTYSTKAVTSWQAHSASCQFAPAVTHTMGIKGKEYSPMERRKGREGERKPTWATWK